jgi:predicted DsbA family dithiol-disulfide isomerase
VGLSGAEVDACLASWDLRAGILAIKSTADADHRISDLGVPTFIINGQKIEGAMPYGVFAQIFNAPAQQQWQPDR